MQVASISVGGGQEDDAEQGVVDAAAAADAADVLDLERAYTSWMASYHYHHPDLFLLVVRLERVVDDASID